jgi:hypothetical protein
MAGCRLQIGALALAVASITTVRAEIIDRVLAVVDGVLITQSDVTAASTLGLVSSAAASSAAAVLAELIDRQLILAEVDRYVPPEPTSEALDQATGILRARFISDEAYRKALARVGLDEQSVRRWLRDDLRMRAYLEQRFAVSVPTDEEVSRYYQEHLETFTRGGRVVPLEEVRSEILAALTTARRAMLVQDWVTGLRRRGNITDLSLPRR